MIRSKKVLVFLSAVVFCLSLSMMAVVTITNAATCNELIFSWDCTTFSSTFVLINSDFTFDEANGGFGYWDFFGPSLFLQFQDGGPANCLAFFSGTKKQGNMQCTDGQFPGDVNTPGCYNLRKTNFLNCVLFDKKGAGVEGSVTDGSSDLP